MAISPVQSVQPVSKRSASTEACCAGGDSSRVEIPHEAIRERAYFLSLTRNGSAGDPEQDWKQAELELRAEAAGRSFHRIPRAGMPKDRNEIVPSLSGSLAKPEVLFIGG